jgi:hypothetical protein
VRLDQRSWVQNHTLKAPARVSCDGLNVSGTTWRRRKSTEAERFNGRATRLNRNQNGKQSGPEERLVEKKKRSVECKVMVVVEEEVARGSHQLGAGLLALACLNVVRNQLYMMRVSKF